jgi:hypothetical protein
MFKAFSNGDSDSESDNHESFSKAPASVQIPIERILGIIDPDEVDDLRVGSSYYDSKWRTVIEIETCDSYEYKITNLTVKEAVAASIACVAIIAVPSIITHQFLGNINWTYALGLSLAVIPGAWLGASLAIRAQERHLRVLVACVLGTIAVGYAIAETIALLS